MRRRETRTWRRGQANIILYCIIHFVICGIILYCIILYYIILYYTHYLTVHRHRHRHGRTGARAHRGTRVREGKSTITTATDGLPSLPRTVHHGARSTEHGARSTEHGEQHGEHLSEEESPCRRAVPPSGHHAVTQTGKDKAPSCGANFDFELGPLAASRRTIAPYSLQQRRRRRLTRYPVTATAYPYTTLATSAHGHCYILSRPLVSSTTSYLARHEPLRDRHFLYHLLCKAPLPARRRQ